MANINGLPVNSAVTHAEFMSRTEDTSTTGLVNFQNATDSVDPTTGSIKTAGGIGVAKSLNVGLGASVGGELIVGGETTLNATLNASDIIAANISGSQVDAPIGNITTVNATTVNTDDLNLTNALTVPSLTVNGATVINGDFTVNGTPTIINSTNVSTVDQNITVNVGGNDVSSEGAGFTVDRTGTKGSLQYANALASKFKIGDLASEAEVATVSHTQTLTNKTISGSSNTLTNIPAANLSGSVPIANGGTGQTTQTAAFDALSPLTTKGDLIVNDGTNDVRLAVGTNNYVLTADSTQASGIKWAPASGGAGVPTIQRFTTGSGTYTTPVGVTYLRVKLVGGGGGAASTGTSGTFAGTNGNNSTFGTSLLTAGSGGGGQISAGGFAGGSGGTTTVNSPAISVVQVDGAFGGSPSGALATQISGGLGGSSFFGGAGGPATGSVAGRNAAANSGSGGSGSGSSSSITGGAGGGAGAYVEAIITSPSSTYAYIVGAEGNGGTAGVAGFAGGNGGSGVVIVEEYY